MLISPPFLPDHDQSPDGQAPVDTMMVGGEPGDGAFPVSHDFQWHGGMHLEAPTSGQGVVPVCAIADGKVIYVRKPTAKPDRPEPNNPLYYHHGWTSDGVVVVQHDTEIGDGDNAKLTYYSVYMHLSEIENASGAGQVTPWAAGKKIWRKDKIGAAGWIYGKPNKLHMEIVLDDDNLRRLIGRSPDTMLNLDADGRIDSLWGEVYVALPANAKVYDDDMRSLQKDVFGYPYQVERARENAHLAQVKAASQPANRAYTQADKNAKAAFAALQAKAPTIAAHKTNYQQVLSQGIVLRERLVVGIRYRKNGCTVTTYKEDGSIVGNPTEEDGNYERQLFQSAMELYYDCPSAGYELLRFGRTVGPDALPADNAAHWRKIAYPGGEGWVDLNTTGASKYSDADFPPWKGWRFVDDDSGDKSKCVSATIQRIVLEDQDACYPVSTAPERLKLDAVKRSLSHCVCKIRSEWDGTNVEQRWGWLKRWDVDDYSNPLAQCMSDVAFGRFSEHVTKLAFWTDAGLPEPAWHVNSREFIRVMRECRWLSESEMLQLLPMAAMRSSRGNWVSERVRIGQVSRRFVESNRCGLNKAVSKFGISLNPLRMAAFLGNAMQETQWFGKSHEDNAAAWYWPWDGRGLLQLTGPANYFHYWRFLGRNIPDELYDSLSDAYNAKNHRQLQDAQNPTLTGDMIDWREDVADPQADASQSAGAYWAWSGASEFGDKSPAMIRSTHAAAYYMSEPFSQVAATVNRGSPVSNVANVERSVNGMVARAQAYVSALMVLADRINFPVRGGGVSYNPDDYQERRDQL